MSCIRTICFYLIWLPVTAIWSLLIIAMLIIPFKARHLISTSWADISIWLLKVTCGIKYEVTGKENIPNYPVVLVSNHQSTWETLFMPIILRNQVWVLKKELLYLPFFGWSMALLGAIAIDRSKGRKAFRYIVEQGEKNVTRGYSIVMFPQGHRFSPETNVKFKSGAARLAKDLDIPILPVAHNSGLCWTKKGLLKPGTIQLVIGAPIPPDGLSAQELNRRAESWVETQRESITNVE